MLVKELKKFIEDIPDNREVYFEGMFDDDGAIYTIRNIYVDTDGDVILRNKGV